MRLLLVEDDRDMVAWLTRALRQGGFATDVAPDARTAEGLLATADPYDAVVLDLGLPDRHGFTVLSDLRNARNRTPVLVLTAQAALPDRVRGLHLGADDFLAKPFAIEELEARLTALIRRSHGQAQPRVDFGALAFELASRSFFLAGERLALTPREQAALTALMLRAGHVVTKSQLSAKVFPQASPVGPDAIELVLHRVRRKLAGGDVRVVTVRGLGYMLEQAPPAPHDA